MDTKTGAIVDGDRRALNDIDAALRRARRTKTSQLEPIPKRQLAAVRAMTPEERIAWADERRKARNKRKAERRARKKQRAAR